MPTVQELITTLRHDTPPELADEQISRIIDAVKTQDTLLAAYHTPTKHYYIVQEHAQQTAVLFTNRDSFEHFAERVMEQGGYAGAIENTKAHRKALLLDLWRCGFTRVIIDYAPEYINLHLGDLFTPPDFSALPLSERAVLDPALTGSILWLMQQIRSGKATGGMELDTLEKLYHAPLLLPVQPFHADGRTAYTVPVHQEEDGRYCHVFTDRREMAASGEDVQALQIARYANLQEILAHGFDRIAVNPDTGASLVLDAQLLRAAEQAAMGQTADYTLNAMQEMGEKVTVTDPEEIPDDLRQALVSVLQNHKEVTAAYLRVIKRDNTLRPSWLLLHERTEDRGEKAFHQELGKAADRYLGSCDLECVSLAKGKALLGNARPFYKKKRFGLL